MTMTTPIMTAETETIPEDVMKSSAMIAADFFAPHRRERRRLADEIARAILAERVACEERYRSGASPNTYDYFKEAADAINPKR